MHAGSDEISAKVIEHFAHDLARGAHRRDKVRENAMKCCIGRHERLLAQRLAQSRPPGRSKIRPPSGQLASEHAGIARDYRRGPNILPYVQDPAGNVGARLDYTS